MFGKPEKKKTIEVNGQQIELQPKPSAFSKVFGGGKPTPMPSKPALVTPPPSMPSPSRPTITEQPKPQPGVVAPPQPTPQPPIAAAKPKATPSSKPSTFKFPGFGSRPAPSQPAAAMPPKIQPRASAPPQPSPQPATTMPPPVPTPSKEAQPNKPYSFQFPNMGQRPAQQAPPPTQATSIQPKPSLAPPPGPIPSTPKAAYQRQTLQPRDQMQGPPSAFKRIIQNQVTKHPDLEAAMRKEGMKGTVYSFIKRMLMFSIIFTAVISVVLGLVIYKLLGNPVTAGVLALMVAFAAFMATFRTFVNFPAAKGRASSKKIERDILFAARDLIIALRSGMPLFNAITSVSSGYGEASKEFLKVVEKVQLGTSLEDAIDQVVSTSKSISFRKIMLQAAVSIKVGADVISALQSVIDQLAQERVIELRRYGQRLNAIAMFYMLFGIILPSMGIAVLTILTTFIPIFNVDSTLLEMVVLGVVFLQVVFLQLIRSSRPVFSM